MKVLNIKCSICFELIATAEPTSLGIPLAGHMLGPPYPERMTVPLLQPTEWEYLRCPVCNNNPFLKNDEVLTDEGIYKIPPDEIMASEDMQPIDEFKTIYSCECCDPPREYDSIHKLNGHKGAMKRYGKQ